jgi:hypothetical protein
VIATHAFWILFTRHRHRHLLILTTHINNIIKLNRNLVLIVSCISKLRHRHRHRLLRHDMLIQVIWMNYQLKSLRRTRLMKTEISRSNLPAVDCRNSPKILLIHLPHRRHTSQNLHHHRTNSNSNSSRLIHDLIPRAVFQFTRMMVMTTMARKTRFETISFWRSINKNLPNENAPTIIHHHHYRRRRRHLQNIRHNNPRLIIRNHRRSIVLDPAVVHQPCHHHHHYHHLLHYHHRFISTIKVMHNMHPMACSLQHRLCRHQHQHQHQHRRRYHHLHWRVDPIINHRDRIQL